MIVDLNLTPAYTKTNLGNIARKHFFYRHDEAVKARVDPNRLLVFDVYDSWEPLRRHLAVPVPNERFPCTNTTGEYIVKRKARQTELETKSVE